MLFLSYAREDRAALGGLVEALGLLGYEVWLDEALTVGQPWWDVILDRIRDCEALVSLVSPAMVRSVACLAEVDYAFRLGKPVLPVALGPMDLELLPPSLGRLHVQRLDGTRRSTDRLAAAVRALPAGGPPPAGRVAPPPAPTSVVSVLADRARAPSLGFDDQLALVARLEDALEQGADRRLLAAVLAVLLDREDLYARVSTRLDRLRVALREVAPAAGPAPSRVPVELVERLPVELVERGPGHWSFQVGWTTLLVSIDGYRPTVLMNGVPAVFTARQRGVRTFQLPAVDGRPVDAALLWRGEDGSDGVMLTVEHVTAYGDGMYG